MARKQQMATYSVTLLAVLLPVEAPAAPYIPTLTGEQFVREMLTALDNGTASMRRERAMGYMDGVMDGTAGLLWCPAGKHVGNELSYLAAEKMKSLPAEQLKKGAAPLIVAALAKIYACPVKGRPS
ncbi:Rap1a/Tai family immunity protein [Massilia timonae]|uniref:Rap1a/Tai family immunity protein n=1 Tax=Massilia timonae TaxID=47229 RepID=UPI0023579215|nr:Rap1a/Tai family immunity protein [Massilia timonae]